MVSAGLPRCSVVKNPPANAGDPRDTGSVPGFGSQRLRDSTTTLVCPCQFLAVARQIFVVQSLSHLTTGKSLIRLFGCSFGKIPRACHNPCHVCQEGSFEMWKNIRIVTIWRLFTTKLTMEEIIWYPNLQVFVFCFFFPEMSYTHGTWLSLGSVGRAEESVLWLQDIINNPQSNASTMQFHCKMIWKVLHPGEIPCGRRKRLWTGTKNAEKSLPKKALLVNPKKSGEGGHWQRKDWLLQGEWLKTAEESDPETCV